MPHCEVFLGGAARELVPRTNQLAVIAPVDAIADGTAKLDRNRPGQFDGEVGNTAPCVESIGRDDGAGGARGHAGGARPAVRAARLIAGQVQVQVNFAQKKIRPGVAIDQVGVFADPTQCGIACQRLFQNRRAVGEHSITEGTHRALDAVAELLQPCAHELVVVAAEGIAGDVGYAAVGDTTHGPGQQFRRPAALHPMTRHVGHLAVEPRAQPVEKMRLVAREIDLGHAETRKAQLLAPTPQVSQQGGCIKRADVTCRGVHRAKITRIATRLLGWPV